MESAWKARRRQRRGIDIGGGGGGEPRAERCIESSSIRQGKSNTNQQSSRAEANSSSLQQRGRVNSRVESKCCTAEKDRAANVAEQRHVAQQRKACGKVEQLNLA